MLHYVRHKVDMPWRSSEEGHEEGVEKCDVEEGMQEGRHAVCGGVCGDCGVKHEAGRASRWAAEGEIRAALNRRRDRGRFGVA